MVHVLVMSSMIKLYSNTGAVHANSLYIEDPSDQGNSNEVRIMTEHQSYPNIHLNIPDLHNFDGHGGRPKSELMVTSVEQTVTGKKVFENIEVHDPTSNNQATNKYYTDNNFLNRITGGQIGGDLDMRGNTIKYLKLDNAESAAARVAELNLKLNRSGDKMDGDINMNNNFIQNIATPTSSHQVTNKGYCDYNFLNRQSGGVLMGPLSMNRNDLTGIPDAPKFGYSAVNKNYVDGEISKIPGTDTSPFLKIDGSRAMTGSLNMNGNQIIRLKEPVSSSDASTKGYTDRKIDNIQKIDTTLFIKKDGSVPMTADLDMGTHKIENVKLPTSVTDVATKGYIDTTLAESHLISSYQSNEFKYLDDPNDTSSEYNITVEAFADFDQSPHKNKKAFRVILQRDVGSNDYRSRMGFNLFPLPLGTYTMIFEYHPPQNTNIQLSCQSTTAYVHRQVQKNFTHYAKLLVQINNNSKTTPDFIFFTIHGTDVIANPEAYIIVYGVNDWSDSVDPRVYDGDYYSKMFEYKNNSMYMNTSIDLNNNHQIKNLKEGTNSSDGVNKSQLDSVSYYSKGHMYRTIFGIDFYDIIETSRINLVQNVSGVVISGVLPNFVLETDRFITDYNPKYALKLSTKTHIRTADIFNQNSSFTFFMSFLHDNTKTGEISFSNTLNIHIKFYPRYRITSNKLIIDYQSGTHETTFTSDFQNKQLFVWICFDGTRNLYKMALSDYSSHVSETFSPPVNFQSRQLEIDYEVYVNKIGFTNRFIDIDDLEFQRITLEEKRNGSYLE